MKLTEEKGQFQTNLDESKSMNFGIGDASVIIDILRNRLYENKIRTLVQEYMSNARDAHREIGQTKKIEVTFPVKGALNFTVRDYGPGITPDRMANVFVLYGASTKRTSNQQTGGFGIGAKSAWAYTDSFTITTYVDGVQRVYVAHIGANKNGRIDLMTEAPTEEPNGTSISLLINERDKSEFSSAIVRGTMFWTDAEYPVFHHGPVDTLTDARELGSARFMSSNLSGSYVGPHTGDYSNHVVIDGIPYPMPHGVNIKEVYDIQGLVDVHNFNVFVPNGLVQVSASREKIDDSDFSKKGLKAIFVAALADLRRSLVEWEAEIVDTPSLVKAREKSTGFRLTSNKDIDCIKLEKGELKLQTYRKMVGQPNQRLFTVSRVFDDTSARDSFKLDGKNRYYMSRSRWIKSADLKAWISASPDVSSIDLITVLGQEELKFPVEGKPDVFYTKAQRNQVLVDELIGSLERMGFKNIETIIPKSLPTPKGVTPAVPVISGNVYRVDSYNKETRLLASTLPADKKGVWIYFLGRKDDSRYDNFISAAIDLKSMGDIEYAFRVTESTKKALINDTRFIEYEAFLKQWKPNSSFVMQLVVNNNCNSSQDSKLRATALNNIKTGILDKTHTLYKIATLLCNTQVMSHRGHLQSLMIQSAPYKEAIAGMVLLNSILTKYMPFLSESSRIDKKHLEEYIAWALAKATQDGVSFDLPKILYVK